jgi:rhamnosyltransferase
MSVLISVIIPTYNSSKSLESILQMLSNQTLLADEIIIIDSSSIDQTVDIAKKFDTRIEVINKKDFDHAGTRTYSAKISKGDILIFLTDDAIPKNKFLIENLTSPFKNSSIAAVGGRQIPNPNASLFSAHLRDFNYPKVSFNRSLQDKEKLGIKTIFLSNSCASYRKTYLAQIGWFGQKNLFGEDSIACAKFLLNGYTIAYNKDAVVYHSHNYSIIEEFKRYFDIGIFHNENSWLLVEFGSTGKEGFKFVVSEFKYLIKNRRFDLIIQQPIRLVAKYFGYKLGRHHNSLPNFVENKLSMFSK